MAFSDLSTFDKLLLLGGAISSSTSRDNSYVRNAGAGVIEGQEQRRLEDEHLKQETLLRRLANPSSTDMIGTPATKQFNVNGRSVGQNAPAQMAPVMSDDMRLRSLQRAMPKQFMAAELEKLLGGSTKGVALGAKDRLVNPVTGQTLVDATDTGDEMTPWQRSQLDVQERRLAQSEATNAAAAKRQEEIENRRNRPQATGYVSAKTGNPLRFDPGGGNYMDGDNVVDSSELVSAGDFNKELTNAREVAAGITRAQQLKSLVEENKTAFEKSKVNQARVKGMIPFVGEQAANSVFTQDEQKVRATVARDAAQIINELYGAALSAGESGRAQGFTPGESDTLEMLLPKLDSAVEWAAQKEKGLLPGAVSKARAQLGVKDTSTPVAKSERPKDAPADARQAQNGKWYAPDPLRPGKYVEY